MAVQTRLPTQFGPSYLSGGSHLHQGDVYQTNTHIHQISPAVALKDALRWLGNLDFAPRLHFHCNKRAQNTGQWLLDDEDFQQWNSTADLQRSTLWLRGDPGCGKTTLCALLIEYLQQTVEPSSAVAYCLFEYSRKQVLTADAVLEDLLRQIVVRDTDKCHKIIEKLYENAEAGHRRPTFDEVKRALVQATLQYDRVFVVVDALDECDHLVRRKLLTTLEPLTLRNVSLLVTGRPFVDLAKYLSSPITAINIRVDTDDLKRYFLARIADSEDLQELVRSHEKDEETIVADILSNTYFSFVAAEIYMNSLEQALTPAELDEALSAPISDLNVLYDQTCQRIQSQAPLRRKLAIHALSWIAIAKRVMTLAELGEALALLDPGPVFDVRKIPPVDTILSACHGLLVADWAAGDRSDIQTSTVRFCHYTILEYLREHAIVELRDEDALKACLKYFTNSQFLALFPTGKPGRDAHAIDSPSLHSLRVTSPFFHYAFYSWSLYVNERSQDMDELLSFLRCKNAAGLLGRLFFIAYTSGQGTMLGRIVSDIPEVTAGIQFAAHMQWEITLARLYCEAGPFSKVSLYWLLSLAAEKGNISITKFWISQGAKVNIKEHCGDMWSSPLSAAVSSRSPRMVEYMLAQYDDSWGIEPIRSALKACLKYTWSITVFDVLLETGCTCDADILTLAIQGERPLSAVLTLLQRLTPEELSRPMVSLAMVSAVILYDGQPCIAIMKEMLTLGINPAVPDAEDQRPLLVCLEKGRPWQVASMILKHDATAANACDAIGRTGLHLAVLADLKMPSAEMFRTAVLLSASPNICSKDHRGDTAMHLVLRWMSRWPIAPLSALMMLIGLLSRGADIDVQNEKGDTPLHILIKSSHSPSLHVIYLLLQQNPDLHLRNDNGHSILELMILSPYREDFKRLFSNEDQDSFLTLQVAMEIDKLDIEGRETHEKWQFGTLDAERFPEWACDIHQQLWGPMYDRACSARDEPEFDFTATYEAWGGDDDDDGTESSRRYLLSLKNGHGTSQMSWHTRAETN